jgi:hypothetical protein
MTFTVTVTHSTGGHLALEGVVSVEEGTTFWNDITPDEGYFTGLATIDGVLGTGPLGAIVLSNVQADHTIYVEFTTRLCTITPSSNYFPNLVGISPFHYQYRNYATGTPITMTATPGTGYRFLYWTGAITGETNPQTFIITSNVVIGAKFVAPGSYLITPSAGVGGTIFFAEPTAVMGGDDLTFTVTSNQGYLISDVLVDGISVGAVASYTFHAVMEDHTIRAIFIPIDEGITFTITSSIQGSGTITPLGAQVVVAGASLAFTIAADEGFVLDDVLVDNSSVGAVTSYTFTNVRAAHTIKAVFTTPPAGTFRITTTGWHVVIDPANPDVVEGANQAFTFGAFPFYEIGNVLVDDVSIGAAVSHTILDVHETHTIVATGNYLGGPEPPPHGGGQYGGVGFRPTPVELIPPTEETANDWVMLYLANNQQYLAMTFLGYPISSYYKTYINCAGEDEYPSLWLGNKAGLGRTYGSPEYDSLYSIHIAFPELKKVVTNGYQDIWDMNGDLLAGCEPLTVTPYTPSYAAHWGGYESACGAELNDYRIVRDNFHPDDHYSYIEFYRLHDGVESDVVPLARSYVYTAPYIPGILVRHLTTVGDYIFTIRTAHITQSGESNPKIVIQASPTHDFSASVTTYEFVATVHQTWIPGSPGYWRYDHHEGTTGHLMLADGGGQSTSTSHPTYLRAKRVDLLADGTISHESSWSWVWYVNPSVRGWVAPNNFAVIGSVGGYQPYLVEWTYYPESEYTYQRWAVSKENPGGYQDQDMGVVRVEVADTEWFTNVVFDQRWDVVYAADGSCREFLTAYVNLPTGATYYARGRYEGAIPFVGPWSKELEMDGDDPTNWSTSNTMISGYTYTPETNWLGEQHWYHVNSNPIYKDGHTYCLIGYTRWVYDTWTTMRSYTYGTLYLADYNGTSIALTQIGDEVNDFYVRGWPVKSDIVEFEDKIYAGWQSPARNDHDLQSCYDWCEITGGIVGEVHHVDIPDVFDSYPPYVPWATMVVVHGDLRVIASIDTGEKYIMAIANILSDAPSLRLFPRIGTGYEFVKDPWLGSIWYDYENYSGSRSGIYWLGNGPQSNAIWFVNK